MWISRTSRAWLPLGCRQAGSGRSPQPCRSLIPATRAWWLRLTCLRVALPLPKNSSVQVMRHARTRGGCRRGVRDALVRAVSVVWQPASSRSMRSFVACTADEAVGCVVAPRIRIRRLRARSPRTRTSLPPAIDSRARAPTQATAVETPVDLTPAPRGTDGVFGKGSRQFQRPAGYQ
jgi:hypothetical protein